MAIAPFLPNNSNKCTPYRALLQLFINPTYFLTAVSGQMGFTVQEVCLHAQAC
jgi:hypothetical protein